MKANLPLLEYSPVFLLSIFYFSSFLIFYKLQFNQKKK